MVDLGSGLPPPRDARIFVAVISPDSAPRNRSLLGQLADAQLDPQWVGGVDLRGVSDEDLEARFSARMSASPLRPLTAGEIGCVLSHREAWARAHEAGLPWALILEDDAELQPRLRETVDLALGFPIEKPVIATLAHHPAYREIFPLARRPALASSTGVGMHWSPTQTWGTVAYLVNRSGLRQLLTEGDVINGVADWPYSSTRCRFYVALPPAVVSDAGKNLFPPPQDPEPPPARRPPALRRYHEHVRALARQYRGLPRKQRGVLGFLRWSQGAWVVFGYRLSRMLAVQSEVPNDGVAWFWRWPRN